MRLLGIDYGEKRIGLAFSDEAGQLAFPKEIVQNDKNIFTYLGEIIKKENISKIVIGESYDFTGKPNEIMQRIKSFTEKLEAEFSLPVFLQNEFFTSVEARRYQNKKGKFTLKTTGRTNGEITTKADARAAALILQRYLDKMNRQK